MQVRLKLFGMARMQLVLLIKQRGSQRHSVYPRSKPGTEICRAKTTSCNTKRQRSHRPAKLTPIGRTQAGRREQFHRSSRANAMHFSWTEHPWNKG